MYACVCLRCVIQIKGVLSPLNQPAVLVMRTRFLEPLLPQILAYMNGLEPQGIWMHFVAGIMATCFSFVKSCDI